jgi:hypothetical protein
MRANRNKKLILGLALAIAGEFNGISRNLEAKPQAENPEITICVHNYANVDLKTLQEAEQVTGEILLKTGVETRWVNADLRLEGRLEESSATNSARLLSRLQLNIYPRQAVERLSIPRNALGLSPGTGTDRTMVYVFYDRIESFTQIESRARMDNSTIFYASQAKILGNVIAHELGHVLLNLEVHTATGIMRGGWDWRDMRDVALGNLCFNPQQAESIRAEAQRRNSSAVVLPAETGFSSR